MATFYIKKADKRPRTIIITITPDNPKKQMDFQTSGDFETIELANAVLVLQQHFAGQLKVEYIKVTGDKNLNPVLFDAWIKAKQTKKV